MVIKIKVGVDERRRSLRGEKHQIGGVEGEVPADEHARAEPTIRRPAPMGQHRIDKT